MNQTCIECGQLIHAGKAYYDNEAARVLIPFAGRLMSDGPFCSKGCKRTYLATAESKAAAKNLKKAGPSGAGLAGTTSSDIKTQRRVLELQKEEREAVALELRRAEAAEEERQRKEKAAAYRAQGLSTLAFLVGNSPGIGGAAVIYLFATFFAALKLGPHEGKMATWVWGLSASLVVVAAILVGRRMYQEYAAQKKNA